LFRYFDGIEKEEIYFYEELPDSLTKDNIGKCVKFDGVSFSTHVVDDHVLFQMHWRPDWDIGHGLNMLFFKEEVVMMGKEEIRSMLDYPASFSVNGAWNMDIMNKSCWLEYIGSTLIYLVFSWEHARNFRVIRAVYQTWIKMLIDFLRLFCPVPFWLVRYLWGCSNCVYLGIFGPSAMLFTETRMFDNIIDSNQVKESKLLKLLLHRSDTVAAYIYVLIYRMYPSSIEEAKRLVANRSETLKFHGGGCFVHVCDLASYSKPRSIKDKSKGETDRRR